MEVQLLPENYQHVDKITPKFDLETKLDQYIKQIIKREGFKDYKIDKKCVSTNGGNYLGDLYEIGVKGTTNEGDKEVNIFIKNIIKSDSLTILSIDKAYNTEIFAYKELSKLFNDLQENASVPAEERYKMVKVFEETNKEAIILENVAKKGYTTYHRMEILPLTFMELCVKQLARFHALSFIIKHKIPDFFSNKVKVLQLPFNFGEEWITMCSSLKKIGLDNSDEAIRGKLEKVYDNLAVKYIEYANDETIKVCLCHGDYRANNIMTKINEDGEAIDIIPVDYQLMHYGCPVYDFLYLIYCSTDRKFRKTHLTYLKDLYYETFKKFLGYFELDADVIYSRDEFEKVYKEKLDQGLMIALIFYPFMLASETDVPELNQDMAKLSFQVDDVFKDRVNDVIKDYVEWGWL